MVGGNYAPQIGGVNYSNPEMWEARESSLLPTIDFALIHIIVMVSTGVEEG